MDEFKTQCDIVKGNPSGMECLGNPHNWSSNPGFIDTAIQKGKEAIKAIGEKYESVKQAYKSGSQETESLGKELAAKQQMTDQARQALKPTSDQEPKK